MQCPICHSDDVSIEDARLQVYRCSSCTHRFSVIQAGSEESYDDAYFREDHPNWFAYPDLAFFRSIHTLIREELGNGPLRLLDVGCGTGDFLRCVHRLDPSLELIGIDLIPNEEEGIGFIQGDIYTTPMPGTFDAIVCLHTIEHIPDPHEFVSIMNRCLRPGGVLFIGTIDSSSPLHAIARMTRHVGSRAAYDRIFSSHHVQHFSFRSLRGLLVDHGFVVVRHFNYNHPMRSVDVPGSGLMYGVRKMAVACIFWTSRLFGKGMLQAILSRKPEVPRGET